MDCFFHKGQGLQGLTVLLPLEEVVRIHRQLGVNVTELGNLLFQDYHLFRVGVGQWPKHHVIDEREDSRSCADSQGQREDGGESKAGRLAQLAQSMTNILKRRVYQVHVPPRSHPVPNGDAEPAGANCPENGLDSATKIPSRRFHDGWRLIPGWTSS